MSSAPHADRVAALVAAAQEGRQPQEEARHARGPKVRRVDWQRPNKFTAEHVRRLRRAHTTFCQSAATRLSAELRTPVDLEIIDVSQLTWSAAQAGLPGEGLEAAVSMPEGGLPVLMSTELPLMMSVIERHLGGVLDGRVRDRKLTEVDLRIARHVFQSFVNQLSIAWNDVVGAPLELGSVELHPGLAHAAPPSEPTLVITAEIRFSGASNTLSVLIPWRAMERFSDRLSAPDLLLEDPEAAALAMNGALSGVAVGLRVEAGTAELPLERVLALAPGEIVALEQAAAGTVRLYADDVPVGYGRPGRSGKRRAVQILSRGGAA